MVLNKNILDKFTLACIVEDQAAHIDVLEKTLSETQNENSRLNNKIAELELRVSDLASRCQADTIQDMMLRSEDRRTLIHMEPAIGKEMKKVEAIKYMREMCIEHYGIKPSLKDLKDFVEGKLNWYLDSNCLISIFDTLQNYGFNANIVY